MGWFGTLASLFSGGIYAAGKIKDAQYDKVNRNESIINNNITYQDSHGNTRLTSTTQRVYSDGRIVRDVRGNIVGKPYLDYYRNKNAEAISKAKQDGKKYAILHHFKNINDPDSVFWCDTDLETMNPYELACSCWPDGWTYSMYYASRNSPYDNFGQTQRKSISEKEFIEYGGYLPEISIEEYLEGKTSFSKSCHKLVNNMAIRRPWE